MPHLRSASMLLVVLLGVGAAPAPDEPVRLSLAAADIPAPSVEWYGLYMMRGTAKVGWLRIEFGKRRDAWVDCSKGHLAIVSMDTVAVIDMSGCDEFDGVAPFAFRGGRSEVTQAGSTQAVEVKKGTRGFVATVVQNGETNSPPVPSIDYTLADALASDLWFKRPRMVGDSLRVRTFSVSDLDTDVETYTVTGRKETIAFGVPTVFYEATTRSDNDGATGMVRTDARGRLLSLVIGEAFEARLESEETAKALERGGDLFVLGMAPLDKPIGPAEKVKRLVLQVEGPGAQHVVDGPHQAVVRDEETGTVQVSLGAGLGGSGPVGQREVDRALAETVGFPTKSPKVVALATRAVGEAKTARERIERLVRFVSDYVVDDLPSGELSVSQIIAQKKGDCSEHARLFVALARAAGVPAREVGGLVYMGDQVQKFGGHAWAEVVLDGEWTPVDPMWNQIATDAAHVTLDREGQGMTSVATLGQLRFRLKEVEHTD